MNDNEIKEKVLKETNLVKAIHLLQNYSKEKDKDIIEHLKSITPNEEIGGYPFNCFDRDDNQKKGKNI